MRQLEHQAEIRSLPVRNISFAARWQWAANAALVTASFIFVGAVILGIFP